MTGQTAKTKKIFDGRYEILSIVGRGACSVVYRARQISTPATELALKVLIDQKGKNPSAERLRREALAMVSCRHRYVARLDDFHSVGSLCYLAMEYAPESDLRTFANKTGGKLPLDQAERFLKQSAEGIAFIHRAGIIHRDIKPENILVMNDKEVRITDFGVALLPGEECSIADLQSGIGTMNYMAPEILEGRPADQRSDLYALGVVFYELLSGQNPFQGSPLARQIDVRKNEKFPSLNTLNSDIPKYLSELIHQCMRYDLDQRFTSCDELLANLLNKKSESFSREQKILRQKPARPKTNNIHKRPRKLQNKLTVKESESPFDEFDRLVAEESAISEQAAATELQSNPESTIIHTTEPGSENSDLGIEIDQGIEPEDYVSGDSPETVTNPIEKTLNEPDSQSQEPDNIESDPSEVNNLDEQSSIESSLEEEMTDDYEEEPPDNKNIKLRNSYGASRTNKSWIGMLVAGLLFITIIPGLRNSVFGVFNSGINSLTFWKSSSFELPIYESHGISFPDLPKGVFSGSLEGVLPGKTVPLSLISFGENEKIVVLLGIDGWTPVAVDPKQITGKQGEASSKTLRVISNGILLEMNGQVNGDKIVGYFSNLINGAQGQWSVEPAV